MAGIERTHPGYDEYRYRVDELGHNPYELTSYLIAKLRTYTRGDVQGELRALFEAQYKAATVQYARTRPVFQEYKARKYSRRFLAEHEADIELYRTACADFKRILDGARPPKMDELKEESRELVEKKKKLYAEYRKVKEEMREVTAAKANIDYLLGYVEPGRKKEQER